jgi:heme-degrading monooxygenase HmoA
MYVVMNVLQVPAEMKERMAAMFGNSSERMRQVPGCLEFQFLSSKEDGKQIVYTKWDKEESFIAWTESENFRRSHSNSGNSPATESQIEIFEVIHSATYDK